MMNGRDGMTRILFYLDGFNNDPWKQSLLDIDPAIDVRSYPDWGTPDDGPAYAFVWKPKAGLLKQYTNIKAIFSIGAGVDHLLSDPYLPKHIPIIRMGDESLKEGMAEYMVMSVLMHHRKMPHILNLQRKQTWQHIIAKPANQVSVGIMGYGTLGKEIAKKLAPFGYKLNTWSKTPKPAKPNITHYSGESGLKHFLENTNIITSVLPSTPETTNLINAETLSWMPKGAAIINAGRGTLININNLVDAIDNGHISGATLDVFPEEPLDADHPLWKHDKIIITPHIAAITRMDSAAEYVIRNIKAIENNQEPENKLDIERGY